MKRPLCSDASDTWKKGLYREALSIAAVAESTGTETFAGNTLTLSSLKESACPGSSPL